MRKNGLPGRRSPGRGAIIKIKKTRVVARGGNGQRGGWAMADSLTAATWFWLLVPMIGCLMLTIVSLIIRK